MHVVYGDIGHYRAWLQSTMELAQHCSGGPEGPDICLCDRDCGLREDWSCCTAQCPCRQGEGDCDDDAECEGELVCGTDNCLVAGDAEGDCCQAADAPLTTITTNTAAQNPKCRCRKQCQPPHDDWDCCTEECPCREGEGDCDEDSHCQEDLVCGTNNCVLDGDPEADCCEVYTTTTTAAPSTTTKSTVSCVCGLRSLASDRIVGGVETEVSCRLWDVTWLFSCLYSGK